MAHCVLIARDFLGDDDFVMYLGDNLLRQGVTGLVDAFASRPRLRDGVAAQILLRQGPRPAPLRRGRARRRGRGRPPGREAGRPAVGPGARRGVPVRPAVHEAVRAIQPSARGELEITDAIQWLIDAGHQVRSQVVEGWWIDTGKLDALLEGNRLILETFERRIDGTVDERSRIEGRVVVQKGAVVEGSTIRGPAIIGEGTRIVDSFIGPFTSIDVDCLIERSEIEHSVVLAQSRISGVSRVADSLIGKEVEVTRSAQGPKALRLMLGDHSRVDLP